MDRSREACRNSVRLQLSHFMLSLACVVACGCSATTQLSPTPTEPAAEHLRTRAILDGVLTHLLSSSETKHSVDFYGGPEAASRHVSLEREGLPEWYVPHVEGIEVDLIDSADFPDVIEALEFPSDGPVWLGLAIQSRDSIPLPETHVIYVGIWTVAGFGGIGSTTHTYGIEESGNVRYRGGQSH